MAQNKQLMIGTAAQNEREGGMKVDYKELIDQFRGEALFQRTHKSNFIIADELECAATAIETLFSENQALLEIVESLSPCSCCIHTVAITGVECPYGSNCLGQYWKWRGVKH